MFATAALQVSNVLTSALTVFGSAIHFNADSCFSLSSFSTFHSAHSHPPPVEGQGEGHLLHRIFHTSAMLGDSPETPQFIGPSRTPEDSLRASESPSSSPDSASRSSLHSLPDGSTKKAPKLHTQIVAWSSIHSGASIRKCPNHHALMRRETRSMSPLVSILWLDQLVVRCWLSPSMAPTRSERSPTGGRCGQC